MNDEMVLMEKRHRNEGSKGRRNRRIVFACVAMIAAMGSLSYAAVPLYQLFCQVTGYGGTTQIAESPDGIEVLDRSVVVRFDANTVAAPAWKFFPAERSVELRIGEVATVNYYVENTSDSALSGMATFNVTPQAAGAYFNKLECFCFTDTRVEAGEKLEMPVVFFVDPAIVDSKEAGAISTITLSYTFFPDRAATDETASSGLTIESGPPAGG